MSQDYRLAKLYEQVYNKQSKPVEKEKPKSLHEAYKTVLVERTAFYAKELAAGEPEDVDPSLTKLGTIENEKESKTVQNRIRSYSILHTTEELLTSAGWAKDNSVLNATELGQLAFDYQIDSNDLLNIVKNKKQLTEFEKAITTLSTKFNFVDKLYEGIKDYISPTEGNDKRFKNFLDKLTTIQGTIDGTNVGPGEFAASLFTNSFKPLPSKEDKKQEEEKGDLLFGNIKVEVKQSSTGDKNKLSGAKLGYAHHAVRYIQSAMQHTIKQSGAVPRSKLAQIRSAFDDKIIEKVKNYDDFGNDFFTDKAISNLKTFDKFILNMDLESYVKQAQDVFNIQLPGKTLSAKYYTQTVENYIKKGFVVSDTTQANTRDANNQKNMVERVMQVLKFGYSKLRELASGPQVTQKDWQSFSPTVAINEFFLSDLGLTSQQLAEVLYEIRPFNASTEGLKQNIQKALDSGYANRLKRGDEKALRGLVFAIHLSEYAHHEKFQFLLLINRTSKQALSIATPESCFDRLLSLYENVGETEFYFRIDLGGRQGAHTISIR